MKPIEFPEQNVVYAKDQPEYQPLPAFKSDAPTGEVVSCWKLSFTERLKILFTGKMWLCLLSFNGPLTPSYMAVNKSEVLQVTNYYTPYRIWNAVVLHLKIVWRSFGKVEYESGKTGNIIIDWKTAWSVASGVWLGGYDKK